MKKSQKHRTKMFFRDILQETKPRVDCKQFKTVTGSPILYTKIKKPRGIYYPLVKRHLNKPKPKQNLRHVCVVYSKTYGREMYGNIDIWPDDELAKEKLLEKLKTLNAIDDDFENEDDVGIDIPRAIEDMSDNKTEQSPENCIKAKSQSDCRHVTIVITDTSEDQHSSTSGDSPFHPVEERPGSPSGTEGSWPLKRSQSIDSRDNPFLPGGNLSKEADEILSKAKIIRDTFILTDAEVASGGTTSDSSTRSPPKTKNVQAHSPSSPTKGNARSKTALNGNNCFSNNSTTSVCQTMAQNEVSKTESSVVQNASSSPSKTRTNENGQLDSEKTLTPRSVGTPEEEPEKKKHNKCCAVM